MSLLDRLKSVGDKSVTLAESDFFNEKEMVPTQIPIINAALCGDLRGGMTSGLTVISGESKRFKSLLGLLQMKAYLDHYPDAVAIFYDAEFGVTPEYVAMMGIPTDRVIHIPVQNIEHLKFDSAKKLDEVKRGDKVFVFVDSIGLLASKKEASNALEAKEAADMTKQKELKSWFRIILPHFNTKNICGVVIGHVYKEMSLFPKDIVSGGQAVTLAANNVWIIGKSQEKDADGIKGWNFTINIEKSRFVKEKSKLTFLVTYEGGINKWSGLMDEALESGHCIKPSNGWYSRKGEDQKFRMADTNTKDFWQPILDDVTFNEFVKNKYRVSNVKFVTEDIKNG